MSPLNLRGLSCVFYGVTTMSTTPAAGHLALPPDETVAVVSVRSSAVEKSSRDEEFAAFVAARGDELLRTAWFLTGDAHRAEELTQQALVRTYAAWSRVRRGDPAAYARRILVNQRVDTWRRRRREVLTDPERMPEGSRPDEHRTANDRDQLTRALALLTPRQRRIVVLRHLMDLPEAEVAAELGVSVGTVKSTASRGLATLRTALTASEGDQA